MAHQILMLGGRRSGKSSILASILYSLGNNLADSLCAVTDQTNYSGSDSVGIPLHAKRIERADSRTFFSDLIDYEYRKNICE